MIQRRVSEKEHLTAGDHVIAGAVSGFVTRFLCQPFDVVKIRFQLQLEPIRASHPTAKYTGILRGAVCILREEGVTAFWKGHVPAQMLSVVYGAVQFSMYEYMLGKCDRLVGKDNALRFQNTVHFTCGFASGCVSTTVAHPFDVIRTRLVAQMEPKTYTSIPQAVRIMWKYEGPRAFYRGMLPTLLQIGPLSGFQFGFYHFFLNLWGFLLKDETSTATIQQGAACGAMAGIVSKTLVYPLDLIKKRLQVQGFSAEGLQFGRYTGFLHCIRCIFVQEGFLGYFKGYMPSVLKAMATTSSYFASYEAACQMLEYWHS